MTISKKTLEQKKETSNSNNRRAMIWADLMKELKRTCPDSFGVTHVEINAVYKRVDGMDVRVSADCDSFSFVFTGKYKGKYNTTVRVWYDSRVTASIELMENRFFEYPITRENENFDQRIDLYAPSSIKNNQGIMAEIKVIYDWTFSAYRSVI